MAVVDGCPDCPLWPAQVARQSVDEQEAHSDESAGVGTTVVESPALANCVGGCGLVKFPGVSPKTQCFTAHHSLQYESL
jgi:hypothetical protein